MSSRDFNQSTSPSVRGDDNQWTAGGMYHRSDRDAFYHKQEAERKERDHVLRASQWFALNLVGLPLHSEQQTWELCRELAETRYGVERVEAMATVIRAAAALVFAGHVERATPDPLPRVEIRENPRTTLYHAAA